MQDWQNTTQDNEILQVNDLNRGKPYFKYMMWSLAYYLFAVISLALIQITQLTKESFATPEKSGATIGYFFGLLLGTTILSLSAALIVWILSRRSPRAGSWAFNIVIVLIILGQYINNPGKNTYATTEEAQTLVQLNQHKKRFTEKITTAKDLEAKQTAFNQYADSVQKSLTEMSKKGEGDIKKLAQIMKEFSTEMGQCVQKWQESSNAIAEPDIFDFSRLDNKEEFTRQKKIINHYIQCTEEYQHALDNAIPNLKQKLMALGPNNPHAQGAIRGATRSYNRRGPILQSLLEANIDYGNHLIQALEYLEQHQGKWTSENGELIFDDKNLLNEYMEIERKIIANETTRQKLGESLFNLQEN